MQKKNASTPNIRQTRSIESEFQALTYFPLMSFIAAGPNIELTCRKGVGSQRKGEGWKWGTGEGVSKVGFKFRKFWWYYFGWVLTVYLGQVFEDLVDGNK